MRNLYNNSSFTKIIVIFITIIIIFLSGIFFQQWGGFDRLIPIVINSLRNNIFGDNFVLYTEKKYSEFNDYFNQRFKKEKIVINESVQYEINKDVKRLAENYLLNTDSLSIEDYEILNRLVSNFYPDISLVYPKTLINEGKWEKFNISPRTFRPFYAKTFIRTDIIRNYSIVYIYKFDMDRLKLNFIPGYKDSKNDICNGMMSKEQKNRALWVFSGGFQYKHGHYGMKYKGEVILPPKNGAATLLFYKNGKYKIVEWSDNIKDSDSIIAFRQNELPLIINGNITTKINSLWGVTPKDTDPIYTVRTGLGFTKNNELVFAFGNNLSAKTLAIGMIKAGVVTGMHLDMNYYNTHFVHVDRTKDGRLKTFNENKVLSYYNNIYLNPSPRDYFILTKKR